MRKTQIDESARALGPARAHVPHGSVSDRRARNSTIHRRRRGDLGIVGRTARGESGNEGDERDEPGVIDRTSSLTSARALR